jgi:hypothetical protein
MIADSERIHTQTLAWILLLDEAKFPNKSKFISSLFKLGNNDLDVSQLYVETEVNHIDLFFQTKDMQFILENKLKSSEHTTQTERYITSIPNRFANSNKRKVYGYLTLIDEKPLNDKWTSISFYQLKEALNSVDLPQNIKETIFIKEYIQTLDNLVYVYNQFVNNHRRFENVFTDGSKKKYEKNKQADIIKDYIRANQLETIFQKAFIKDLANQFADGFNYELSETRGNANIQFYLKTFINNNENFRIGFQFQGKTLKINLAHENYANSKPDQITDSLKGSFKKLFLKTNGYDRFNNPRSKAYISVSKNIPKELYEMEKSEIIEILRKELLYAQDKASEFEKTLMLKD